MKRVVLSFSGGKDSSFALYKLQKQGIRVVRLLTTIHQDSKRTVAHGEKTEKLVEQARRIGIPIDFLVTDFAHYTANFTRKAQEMKEKYGVDTFAFGDIYLTGHREWGENICKEAGVRAYYPLWTAQENSLNLLKEYVAAGFKSTIIKVDQEKLPATWVGREIEQSFIQEIVQYDVCPLGESGEYHSFVYDGPIFKK